MVLVFLKYKVESNLKPENMSKTFVYFHICNKIELENLGVSSTLTKNVCTSLTLCF